MHCAGLGTAGQRVEKCLEVDAAEGYKKTLALFDVERDTFPYDDESMDVVLACEIIEHLAHDPLHMLREIRRILRHDGMLILTTPNCSSLTSMANILYQVSNPYVYSQYPPRRSLESGHVREFVPCEVRILLAYAGLEVVEEFTRFIGSSYKTHAPIRAVLETWNLPSELRGEQYFVAARKAAVADLPGYPESIFS